MHLQDILHPPKCNVEVDVALSDAELFMKLYCQAGGLSGLGDMWVDAAWSKYDCTYIVYCISMVQLSRLQLCICRQSSLYAYKYIYIHYTIRALLN